MIVQRFLTAFIVMACLAAAPAGAQLKPFDGWSLGLNVNRATTATQFGGAGITSTMGDTDANSSLEASYGFAIGERYKLGLGMTLGMGDLRAGTLSLGGSDLSFRLRNMYSLYAEPGYALGEGTLLYGKLSYLGGRGEESYGGEIFGKTYAGLGLGAGMRTMLGERLYLQVELLYGDYEWKTARTGAFRPTSTTGSLGLGWRF
jgi:opacity protein-like surface antigen